MILLTADKVCNKIYEELTLAKTKKIPKLAIVRIGDNKSDISYEKSAIKKMAQFNFLVESYVYSNNISNEEFIEEFKKINKDNTITSILLMRPLPSHIDEKYICSIIDVNKDVDGISPINMYKVFSGDDSGFAPCTPSAVIELLDTYNIDVSGKHVVILGRSMVVGKPLSMLMLKKNASISICHSYSSNIKNITKRADILITCIGKAKCIDNTFVKKGAIVIDVGINFDEKFNLCGDVDFNSVENIVSMITPVPKGVGAVTTSILAKHIYLSANQH